MRRLTDDEFKATAAPEKKRVDLDEEPPFDFWGYFERIPPEDFGDHAFSEGRVSYAWTVAGHHLLDLNRLYGLT